MTLLEQLRRQGEAGDFDALAALHALCGRGVAGACTTLRNALQDSPLRDPST